jgi:Fic family protein
LLVRIALVHVQFETIHPFLDGNGRLGRLLITFMLCHANAMHAPLLYLSLFLKQHRSRYYNLLQAVRDEGAWQDWLVFFLEAVAVTAEAASDTIRRMLALFNASRLKAGDLGRHAPSALRVLDVLEHSPIVSISSLATLSGFSFPTASAALKRLEQSGLVRELSGQARGRTFAYHEYLALLSEGTEPLGAGDER